MRDITTTVYQYAELSDRMTLQAFLTAYEKHLATYAPALLPPCSFLHDVRQSLTGNPPNYELFGSHIAQAAWQSIGGEGDVTTEKLRALP